MRRIIVLLAAMLFTLGLTAGPAAAFLPPGEGQGVDEAFDCVSDGGPPAAHPGSAGLVDATPLVAGKTDGTSMTAWNAAFIDNPVGLAPECEENG